MKQQKQLVVLVALLVIAGIFGIGFFSARSRLRLPAPLR